MAKAMTKYLIDEIEDIDSESLKLPSIGETLGYFLHEHRRMHTKTIRDIAKIVTAKVFSFYRKVRN